MSFLPAMATGLAVLTLLGLGVWQLDRHERKKALLAELSDALHGGSAPLALVEAEAAIAEDGTHDRLLVTTTGMFVHREERYLFALRNGEPGWHVITPLAVDLDGRLVLVDRGFVPAPLRSAGLRPAGQPRGSVTVKGLLRSPRAKGMFTPANEPHNNNWYWVDIPALLASLRTGHGRSASPFLLEALPGEYVRDETWPKAERPELAGVANNHRGYAFTWFALAAALTVIAMLVARAGSRRDRSAGTHQV